MQPTPKMIEAFCKAYDDSLEMQPRETSQAIYEGLTAALSQVEEHAPVTDEVKPVAWLRPSTVISLAEMAGGAKSFQIANIQFSHWSVPVYAAPQPSPTTSEIRNQVLEAAANVAETGDWYGQFQTTGDERRAGDIAKRIRALKEGGGK